MSGSRNLLGKVAALALAFGAVSLAVGAAQKWFQRRKAHHEPAKSKETSKKRPHSALSTPDSAKRHRLAELRGRLDEQGPEDPLEKKGSVKDMSALLAAKIAVPDSDQGDPEKLGQHYKKMAEKFISGGLNLAAVTDAGKYYSIHDGKAEPLEYAKFETPLARGAVRLGVFRVLDERPDNLATEVYNATQSILKALPTGYVVHTNDKHHYHLTIQMISHPSDPRPDTFTAGGGLDKQHLPSPIPTPSASVMRKEQELYRAAAAAGYSPALTVHSVVFADSGALLLLFTDSTGLVFALRKHLKQALPGAAEKQPSILHATLARVLTAEQLDDSAREEIVRSCKHWTNHLRGKRLVPKSLWHVQENTFTFVNVDESSLECPFMSISDDL